MEQSKKYIVYSPGQTCSVPNCSHSADYEVYLYDYYEEIDDEFFEQDYTCPFLCESHMKENELRARGRRVPRGDVGYPFTNRYGAQGYTKYLPIKEVYPQVYSTPSNIILPEIRNAFSFVNEELLRRVARNPQLLHELNPRKFEELVAEIFNRQGFKVELTPQTRDGGKDIYAVKQDGLGTSLYVIECKRYSSSNKVGVEIVRGLYGVIQAERATMGLIATTSTFTPDAIDFATPLKYQLSLNDYRALTNWLEKYKN